MRFTLFLIVLSLIVRGFCDAKIFTRCSLSRQLLKIKGFQKTYLGTWVCLIEKVSKRDTSAFLAKPSGKKYYGLYQIPNEWCREKKRGGLCNMTCEALLDDDIRDDTACALQIAEKNGFQFWSKWTSRCKNDNFITTEIYNRTTSTAGHRPPPSVATQTGPVRHASISYPRPSPSHRSTLWEAFQRCVFRCPDLMRLTPERSLSSSSQYRRSPPRLRRSAYKARRIYKVTRSKRSRHIN